MAMWCDKPDCPTKEIPVEQLCFAGYGYSLRYHRECCPRRCDGSPCFQHDHRPIPVRQPRLSRQQQIALLYYAGAVPITPKAKQRRRLRDLGLLQKVKTGEGAPRYILSPKGHELWMELFGEGQAPHHSS